MHRLTVILSLLGILNPYTSFAQTTVSPTKVIDIQLDPTGKLTGQVVDATGKPLAGSELKLNRLQAKPDAQQAWQVEADAQGRFEVNALVPGTYRLETINGVVFCRCWKPAIAPPSAGKSLLVVDDLQVARGQQPIGELFRSEPLLIAALVTAAIAIPIAVHKSRDDAPEGS